METLLRSLQRGWRGAWAMLPPGLMPLRVRLAILARRLLGEPPTGRYDPADRRGYAAWLAIHVRLKPEDRAAIRAHIAALGEGPLVSVLLPAAELGATRAVLASLRAQLWPRWEVCVDLGAAAPPALHRLLATAAAQEPRIRIGAAPRGDLVLALPPETRLAEEALYELAVAALAAPEAAVFYADEDRIDPRGKRFAAWLKPDFDPYLLLAQDLFGSFAAYRRALWERLPPATAHARALRAAALAGPAGVRHISAILSHAPEPPAADPAAAEAALRAAGIDAQVTPAPLAPHWSRIAWPLPDPAPLVSIIVPTRDRAGLLAACAEGVLGRTDYPAIEFLVVDNGSTEPETHALFARLAADPRVRILPAPGPFNYSALNNQAATAARGEILLLLNNDIEVIEPGWLREMVSLAVRPEVGAVGAKLLYADGRLQHGGVVTGVGGVADHYLLRAARDDPGHAGSLALTRQAGAVTGACLALRRAVYAEVGGLDAENLAVAFNDVDLCMKIREAGYRILWTPFAELFHLESASRGQDLTPEKARRFAGEIAHMRRHWGAKLLRDPFYSPWLSLEGAHGALAHDPRRVPPWAPFRRGPLSRNWRATPPRRGPMAAQASAAEPPAARPG